MIESNFVRGFIIVYIIIASPALYLLWNNSAAPDALKNAGILIVTFLPVVLTLYPYFKQENLEKTYNYYLFFDSNNKSVIMGNMDSPYHGAYMNMFTNVSFVKDNVLFAETFSDLMKTPGLDIIEKGILESLVGKFGGHWDVTSSERIQGPSSSSERWSHGSKRGVTKIEISKLRKIFKHNRIISEPKVLGGTQLSLPPSSKIIVNQSEEGNLRNVIFDNPYAPLQISIQALGGNVNTGVWGVILDDHSTQHRYSDVHYKVSISMKVNRMKVYSPEMKYYRRWYDNMSSELSKYDWEIIERKVEKKLKRDAISKILGIK